MQLSTRFIIPFTLLCLLTSKVDGQMVINSTVTPDDLVQTLVGTGISYSNVTFNGGSIARGTFSGQSNIGIASGVVLATGNVNTIPNPPNGGMGGSGTAAVQNDPDMNAICGINTNNGSILEFDFIPQGSQLVFNYVFSSEEYATYAPPCPSPYNDGFGFFISGPGISGPYSNSSANIALIPSTTVPVSINNVNCVTNPDYYITNYNGSGGCSGCGNSGKITDSNFVFNAYTTVFQATVTVIACTTYHIKLAVANASDQSLQTGVFLEESSFSSNPITLTTTYTIPTLDTTTVEGCNSATVTFGIDSIPSLPVTIPLTYGGTAINGIDYFALPPNLVIPAGSQTASLNIVPINDGLPEGQETIDITYSNVTCSGTQNQTATFYINDYPPLTAHAPDDMTVNCSQTVNLLSNPIGGIVPYVYLWSTGDTTAGITVNPVNTSTYSVQIWDGCGSVSSDTVTIIVLTPSVDAGANDTTCSNLPITFTGDAQNYLPASEQWTHFGTGILTGASTLSPTYTPGPGETGLVKIKFTVAGTGGCAGQFYSDSLYLLIDPLPTANAGPDAAMCQVATYTLSGTANDYNPASVTWSENGPGSITGGTTLTPVYTPINGEVGNATFTLTVSGTGACASQQASDNMILTVDPPPYVVAGAGASICAGSSYALNNSMANFCQGLQWTSSGTGTFDDPTALHAIYTPSAGDIAAGSVTLTLKGDGALACFAIQSTDALLLTINPLPVANAGADDNTCQGMNYTVSGASALFTTPAGVLWTENGPGSLTNANTLTPTYVPAFGETGTVTLTLTVSGALTCSAQTSTDTRLLTFTPLPDVVAGNDATICAASNLNLGGTQQFCSITSWTTSGDGGFSNPNLLNAIYTPGPNDIIAGSVTLILSGQGMGTCTSIVDADALTLTIDPMPIANAGNDSALCVLNPIQVNGAGANNYTTLQWFGGDGTFNNNTLLSPTYMPGNLDFNNGTVTLTLSVHGRLACASQTVTDTRMFSVSPYPLVNAGPDDYICSNTTQYPLNGLGNNYNAANVLWTFSGGDGVLSNPNILNPIYFAGPIDLSTVNRTVTFTLTLQGIGNCNSILVNDQVVLQIDPTPVSNAGPDGQVCGQRPYPLAASAQYQSIINWYTSGDGSFSNPNLLNPTYTPGPNDVGNVVILTLNLSGCQSLTGNDFMWLTVHPDPSATISGTTGICEAIITPISIAFTGTPPWSVTYTNGTTPVTVNNINISPYVFSVSPPVTTSYWVMACNDANCNVPNDSIHGLAAITVNPLPDPFLITVTNGGIFCEGTPGVTIGLSGSQTGMNYELLLNGLLEGTTRPGTGNPLSFGIKNVPGQYSIRGTNPVGNCELIMQDTVTVIMNPIPVTDFTTNSACNGDTTFFAVSGNYIAKTSYWHWDFGDGSFAIFNAPTNPYHVYPTYGIYTVILSVEDTNNCTYSITHPVEVRPHPTAFFSFATPNCLGGQTQFTELSINPAGQGYINQWIWNFGDGSPADTISFPNTANPLHTYANAGTYLVTLNITNSRGCTDSFSSAITVTRRPVANFNFWSNCQDETAIFNDASNPNGGGQVTSWLWDFGDPTSGALNISALQNPTHIYSSGGAYLVMLIVTNFNGCSDTLSDTVHVKTAPLADFISSSGCLGSPTLFWADSTLINIYATATYHWDFGDGSTANSRNTQHTYLAAGAYTVNLTITDTAGCEGVKSHILTVNPPPTAHFSASADNCQGQAVAFTNLSTTVTGYLTTWSWDFGDGSPVQTIPFPNIPNVSHSYGVTGSFNVTLTVMNSEGCTHSETLTINVYGAPTAEFMSEGHCLDEQVHFTDLTTVSGLQSISLWSWNFGDPASGIYNTSNLQNPVHTYAAAGAYTVTLTTVTGNACLDSITHDVTIKPLPVTDFTTASACQDNPAQFTPSGMNTGAIASWYWTFGDGNNSTLPSPTHIYIFAGTYSVTLTVTDTAGCSNFRSRPIIIVPLPVVNFDYTSPTCHLDPVQFTDLTTAASGYVANWYWDFGDGSSQTITFPVSPSVSHSYSQPGTFNVTLTVSTNDSCTNQISKTLTILPKPTAAFSRGSACQGAGVSFTDYSLSNTTSGIAGWNWNFGDPTSGTANLSTLQNPSHIYNTAGSYTVQLIAAISGGCSDTATLTFTVSPPPAVDFSSVAGCSGDTTQFTSSTGVNVAATQSWYWQFGDGLSSTLVDPVHIYAQPGTFTVTLTITDTAGCVNTKINTVNVIPGPVANFSFSAPGCSAMPVTFTDLGNANGGTITSWYWNFGDGSDTTFTTYTPTIGHTYSLPGTFLVTLSLQTQQGCANTRQIPLTISPAPITLFSYSNTCQGFPTQFLDETSLNGGSILIAHSWDFGDPASGNSNTSLLQNPVHSYASPGSYLVTLVTTNASGCLDSLQQNVSIVPKPGVDFYSDSLLCLGSVTTFYTDTVATATMAIGAYSWNFGDGTAGSSQQNPQHSYSVAGTFTVTLTISDTSGCMNAISHPVTIHDAPVSSFTYLNACAQAPTRFTDLSLPPANDTIVGWYWDFGLPFGITTDTSTLQNPQYTYMNPGTYTISLTTTTEHGCSDTKTMPLQIWNKPTAYFRYTASPCANGAVQFQDSSWSYQATVTNWQWEFEPYQFGTGQNPAHVYYAIDSCYDVKLMITDIRGCVDTVIQPVCVPPLLTATFNYQQACFGEPMQFSPQLLTPVPPADSLIAFNWNFGDPPSGTQNNSTAKTPTHVFTQPGFYTVNFSTTDIYGCTTGNYRSLQVYALPVASFSSTPGLCDSTVTFTSASIDTAAAITTLYWNFGDGTLDTLQAPLTSVTHRYNTPGQYLATLTAEDANGCTATVSDSVRRNPCIVAAYFAGDSVLCQNYSLGFTDMSSCDGAISQWEWTWGDTSQPTLYNTYQALTSHTFTLPGTYSIRLKVTTLVGGSVVSDSITRIVTVIATPLAGFVTENVCYLQRSMFTDTTLANGATLLSYRWEFGDPQSVYDTAVNRNPSWVYPAPGSYDPRLIVTNQAGCRDTATVNINIYGRPSVSYNSSLACIGQPTYFFDHSQPYLAPVNLWGWRVNDSLGNLLGSMQGATPQFVFDSLGTYQVLLTASDTNGCADTLSARIQAQLSPFSAFSYTENVKEVQGQVQFNDGSVGAREYHWDFGNGEISSAASPLITYADDGTYTVTLVTLNEEGCSDTSSMQYTLLFKGLWVPNAFAPGGTIQQTRLWKPAGLNLATYHCQVYNSFGALIWESKLLDEKGAPVEAWDGTYKDHPVQQDVYIWKIQAVFRDGTIWNNNDVGNHEKLSNPVFGTIVLIR